MLDAGKQLVTAPPVTLQDVSFYQVAVNLWQVFHQLMSMTTPSCSNISIFTEQLSNLNPCANPNIRTGRIFRLCYEKQNLVAQTGKPYFGDDGQSRQWILNLAAHFVTFGCPASIGT
jgi:hypothetical protein